MKQLLSYYNDKYNHITNLFIEKIKQAYIK